VIPQMLLVLNSKGGVGKTSLVAGLASTAAASGWKVLAIDLDPQGNLARDFGYMAKSDQGAALRSSMIDGTPLEVLHDVRENLDVVPGGSETAKLFMELSMASMRGDMSFLGSLERAVAPIASNYSLVLVDLPPGDQISHRVAAAAGRFVLVPTKGDAASTDGLVEVLTRIVEARQGINPALELLGIAVTFIPKSAKSVDEQVRANLRELLGPEVVIFEPTIRHTTKAAIDLREQGQQSAEYEGEKLRAESEMPWYRALARGEKPKSFASAASGLAEDYQKLSEAVLGRIVQRLGES